MEGYLTFEQRLVERGLISADEMDRIVKLQHEQRAHFARLVVELGFVSNKTDLKSLISTEWRERTADSIVQAVDTYFTTRLAVTGQD